MDIYVVDTNNVFSACIRPASNIGQFISSSTHHQIKLYAPEYLKEEIERHFDKIVVLSKMDASFVREQISYIYSRIQFIPEREIPLGYLSRAAEFVRDVDEDDVFFVALAEFFGEELWTGDRELFDHLVSKGYKQVVDFDKIKLRYPHLQ
jgi:predicted nucleic acid-binding protein